MSSGTFETWTRLDGWRLPVSPRIHIQVDFGMSFHRIFTQWQLAATSVEERNRRLGINSESQVQIKDTDSALIYSSISIACTTPWDTDSRTMLLGHAKHISYGTYPAKKQNERVNSSKTQMIRSTFFKPF